MSTGGGSSSCSGSGSGSFILLLFCSVALFSASVASSGCAKVGDPLPPLVEYPSTTRDLELVQIADRVHLMFSLPAGEIEKVEIYRRADAPIRAGGEAELIRRIPSQDLLRDEDSGRFVFQDRPAGRDRTWYYALRFVNEQGRRSDFSRAVHTRLPVAALPPVELTDEVHEDRIVVRWRAPEANIDGSRPAHVVGYLVDSRDFVSKTEYVHREFQFGEPQTYRVQTVTRRADPLILSEFSDTLTVVPRDVFPPTVPQNLTALFWEGKIRVLWDANKEVDLQGYFLYKGRCPDRLEKSSSLVMINSYTDESAAPEVTWYFQATAVDKSGNESARSKTVQVVTER